MSTLLWQVTTYNFNGMPHSTLFMREDNAKAYAATKSNLLTPVNAYQVHDIWRAIPGRRYVEAMIVDGHRSAWLYEDIQLVL